MGETKRKFLGLFRSRSTSGSPRPQERDRDRERERDRKYGRERNPSYSPTRRREDEGRKEGGGRREEEGRRDRKNDDNAVLELRYEKPRHEEERRREEQRREGERKTPRPRTGDGHRHGSVSKGDEKGRATPGARHSSAPQPLAPKSPAPPTQALSIWPPSGYTKDGSLSQGKAMEFIAAGTPIFKGHRQPIPHAPEQYYHLYATYVNNSHAGTDQGDFNLEAFAACSMKLQDSGPATFPWDTLEQPSMAFYYGTRPGTVTLNQWIGLSGKINPSIELRESEVKPREVEFSTILERLIHLESNFEEDSPDLLYKSLYKNLLRDPDKYKNPHKAMELQIADLITVLSRREWIDFSLPHNQVVAKFFANATYTDNGNYKRFFHQLLLSMELDCRIQTKSHAEWAKEKLLGQLPPCIRWTLAVARKWREGMSIEKYKTGEGSEQIRFHLKLKSQQTRALRKFAKTMNWPNLHAITHLLSSSSSAKDSPGSEALENRSSDCLSFFTGMILPGSTLPWLTINSLIDIDPLASSTTSLNTLSHMYPHTGFQYRSTTYWSTSSIVGKVLAPTAKSVAGWIGPCRPAPDLERTQTARIRQRTPKTAGLLLTDITSMMERSDPLGPPSKSYPIKEYTLPLPDLEPENVIDTIRIEKLALKPVLQSSVSANFLPKEDQAKGVKTYDAAVQFAVDGRSWPLRLSFDVEFVSAVPCKNGPHALFFDYVYEEKRVDEVLSVRDWGRSNRGPNTSGIGTATSSGLDGSGISASSAHTASKQKSGSPESSTSPTSKGKETSHPTKKEEELDDDSEKVLVVSAFGVSDNEVLARAWCSHWGLSAIVADVERTCISCAVREAYAACINVVILVEGTSSGEDETH